MKGSPSTHVKIKVNYVDDIFVILLSPSASYQDLIERVEKKIRLCGGPAGESQAFRIKYRDEDGDLITINSDEDVSMALETNLDQPGTFLTLFASAK